MPNIYSLVEGEVSSIWNTLDSCWIICGNLRSLSLLLRLVLFSREEDMYYIFQICLLLCSHEFALEFSNEIKSNGRKSKSKKGQSVFWGQGRQFPQQMWENSGIHCIGQEYAAGSTKQLEILTTWFLNCPIFIIYFIGKN